MAGLYIPSAVRPVPHSEELPVPVPRKTWCSDSNGEGNSDTRSELSPEPEASTSKDSDFQQDHSERERFHEDIFVMKKSYQDRKDPVMMGKLLLVSCEREQAGVQQKITYYQTLLSKVTGQAHRAITPAVIAEVDGLIRGNRRIAVQELRRLVEMSQGSVNVIATKHLHYRKICAQWVPHQLTEEQKTNRIAASLGLLQRYHEEEKEEKEESRVKTKDREIGLNQSHLHRRLWFELGFGLKQNAEKEGHAIIHVVNYN
ncbi:hypothetical protein ANN_02966 [Periplaneta americana]|uniref:Uncharacterized protein n=1 Tax=Periplaneta americana TaxID=6978 RepID=A0ABQ8U098_PERAM|nr:hypothetical protein ANN_02966 [Periplaneta americana]